MHYKRRSKRRDKRKMFPCGCCEDISYKASKEPLTEEDEICNGKVRRKKPRKPKEKCPVNRVHEWYREDVFEKREYGGYWWSDSYYYPKRSWTSVYRKSTCIHCWKEKTKYLRTIMEDKS